MKSLTPRNVPFIEDATAPLHVERGDKLPKFNRKIFGGEVNKKCLTPRNVPFIEDAAAPLHVERGNKLPKFKKLIFWGEVKNKPPCRNSGTYK